MKREEAYWTSMDLSVEVEIKGKGADRNRLMRVMNNSTIFKANTDTRPHS